MNEELQRQIAAYLQAIADAARQGADFAIEQAPLLVQEQLMYGRVMSMIPLVLLAVLIPLAMLFAAFNRNGSKWAEAPMFALSFGALFSFIVSIATLDMFVKSWFAPRVYVLEWAMGLLK